MVEGSTYTNFGPGQPIEFRLDVAYNTTYGASRIEVYAPDKLADGSRTFVPLGQLDPALADAATLELTAPGEGEHSFTFTTLPRIWADHPYGFVVVLTPTDGSAAPDYPIYSVEHITLDGWPVE